MEAARNQLSRGSTAYVESTLGLSLDQVYGSRGIINESLLMNLNWISDALSEHLPLAISSGTMAITCLLVALASAWYVF
jgi:hypothetical protein